MPSKKPVYLFYGEEDFLIDCEIEKLKASLKPFLCESIDGEREDAETAVIEGIRTPPMFGSSKLMLVKNLKNGDSMIDSIKGMAEGVGLIFTAEKVDKRSKFFKFISSIGEVREFRPFMEWQQEELLSWIIQRIKERGKSIGSHGANYLLQTSGRNLREVSQEIEKLTTYVGDKNHIDEADVKATVREGAIDVFAFLSAIRQKNLRKAHYFLYRLLKNAQDPSALVSLLATQIRMLLQVKSLSEKKYTISDMAEKLGAKEYFVRRSLSDAKAFTVPELLEGLKLLHLSDLQLKTSSLSPAIVLELLVLNFLSYGKS